MVGAVRSSYKMAQDVKAFLELRPKWLRCELYCFVFCFNTVIPAPVLPERNHCLVNFSIYQLRKDI